MATSSLLLPSPVLFSNPKTTHRRNHHHCLRQPIKSSFISVQTLSPLKIPSPSPFIADSTRTVTTKFSPSGLFTKSLQNFGLSKLPDSQQFLTLGSSLHHNIFSTVEPAFFATIRDRPIGNLNMPLTVVAAGLVKWLDIYSGVLVIRVLLSWFPNVPWDRQPFSALRSLCDPYLSLFRNIIPPVFDTLDVSPLLAFAVLGALGSILNTSRGM